MQWRSLLKTCLVAIALSQVLLLAAPTPVAACPSSHGVFTSSLCNQESLVGDGAYLISPDGLHRLFMQGDGHIVSYDTTTNPPTPLFVFYGGSVGFAHRLLAGTNQQPPGFFGYQLYDQTDTFIGVSGGQDGANYIKLHDDACVWFHFADDSFNSGVCSTGQ
jgi:hypothetical protein